MERNFIWFTLFAFIVLLFNPLLVIFKGPPTLNASMFMIVQLLAMLLYVITLHLSK